MSRWLRSLRSRLIASHLAIIVIVFLLTVLLAAVPVRRAQLRAEERRLETVVESVSTQTDLLTARGLPRSRAALDAFLRRQARTTGTRLLLVDASGTVVADTRAGGPLIGSTPAGVDEAIDAVREAALDEDSVGDGLPLPVSGEAERIDGYIAVIGTSTASNDRAQEALYPIALAPSRVLPVVDRVVRPLLFAAGVAATLAVVASLWLARSLSRPISNLTAVATRVDAGHLEARAPGEGPDEVGRLVRAFNDMLARLAGAYRSQRSLLANIAHELRSPLTSIQGYATALREGVTADEREREAALLAIHEESGRMADLVDQILQLSRLESEQLPLNIATVEAVALLERLRREHAGRAAAAGVTLNVESEPALALECDADLLAQALGNLVGNAIRLTPAGGRIELRARRVHVAGAAVQARLTVQDSGPGIDPADLPHIFDRFYRGTSRSGAVNGDARGFGLGLAIAREIVARHGGQISVESEPGRGTVFTIDLPGGQTEDQREEPNHA